MSEKEQTGGSRQGKKPERKPLIHIDLEDALGKAVAMGKVIGDGAAAAGKVIGDGAVVAGKAIGDKAAELKDSAAALKDDIMDKLTELDRMLEASITEYNDAFTLMNDKGVQLFIERHRAVDTIGFVESLVNSIANHPKAFDVTFEEIRLNRESFLSSCEFGERQLQAAREAAGGAGAGLAAGASVAFMAPTAAMWVATTFGTAMLYPTEMTLRAPSMIHARIAPPASRHRISE